LSKLKRPSGMLFLRVVLFFSGIGICVFLIHKYLPAFQTIEKFSDLPVYPHGLLAFILFTLHVVLVFYAWHFSLILVEIEVSLKNSVGIFLTSLITRYIPGGVWHLGSRLLAMSRLGKSTYLVGITLFLEQMAALLVCILLTCLFFMLELFFFPDTVFVSGQISLMSKIVGLVAGCGLLIILYPPFFRRSLTWLYKRVKKQQFKPSLSSQGLYTLYGIHALSLLVYALGYYQVLCIVVEQAMPPSLIVIGVVLLSTLLGFLAPFVPGGIGIRESVIVVLLMPFVGATDATAMALLGRIVIVFVEFILFFGVIASYQVVSHD